MNVSRHCADTCSKCRECSAKTVASSCEECWRKSAFSVEILVCVFRRLYIYRMLERICSLTHSKYRYTLVALSLYLWYSKIFARRISSTRAKNTFRNPRLLPFRWNYSTGSSSHLFHHHMRCVRIKTVSESFQQGPHPYRQQKDV